ncbi:hypothetical protein MNBD_UNCLBAC01-41 [hydrothermal vent metagenome]|uniref:Uncharacterized protein n=1 Tax=hydrothermal vent metagenome TaxID=652676 RepID=A0A3B1DH58_9ZZZZ
MILNEILKEKYRTQKRLSDGCENIHEYFVKSHVSAQVVAEKHGIVLNYKKLSNKSKILKESI